MRFDRSTSLVSEVLDGEELAAVESPLEDWGRLAVIAYWYRVVADELGDLPQESESVSESSEVAEVVPFRRRSSRDRDAGGAAA